MPDQFIKFPRVESIQYFESAMYGHNKVLRCKKVIVITKYKEKIYHQYLYLYQIIMRLVYRIIMK